jgi:Putative adhesin
MKSKSLLSSIVLLFICITSNVFADDYYKEFRKSYSVNSNVKVNLDVSFVDVDIQTTSFAQMDIVVKMDIDASNEERANEVFSKIQIDIIEGMAETRIAVNPSSGNNKWKNKENLKITVMIKMPVEAILNGEASFGDVTIGDMKGNCTFDIEYGDFSANGLWSYKNDIENTFGDAKIEGTNGGKFHNEYGDTKIALLQGYGDFETSFGDLDVDRVSRECTGLEVEVQYGDADITVANDAGFTIVAEESYGNISLPASLKKTLEKKETLETRIEGTIGNGANKMKLDCSFGDVKVRIS